VRVWGYRAFGVGLVFGLGAVTSRWFTQAYAEAPEPTSRQTEKDILAYKENVRDQLSSQHLQVKKSWENPGVYAWGSNLGKVVAPDSDEEFIKTPRRIPSFDGVLLRDLRLDRDFGAAITENGDLLQWGAAYSKDTRQPVPTLKGKNLLSLALSRDRIIALSSDGQVYSVPVSKEDQAAGPKPAESTWIPFWSVPGSISYRLIRLKDSQRGEKVSKIRGGLDHVLLLTSKGRLFSAASSSEMFPSKGQLGISGLTWNTRPAGPYDQPHEIVTLRGFDIVDIAAGDYHSLAVDRDGRVFAFGDNSLGQLGFDYNAEATTIDTPSLIPLQRLYQGSNVVPRVTGVAAGGSNSFFTVDTTPVGGGGPDNSTQRGLSRVTSDTFSCGQGIWGSLGNGRWTHVQGTPTKIKALSGLFEWDEDTNQVAPIRLSRISVGSTHAAATMNNVTRISANAKTSVNDTNYGADVLWWGGNQFYQLGTGKRNNLNYPGYIAPLDHDVDKERGRRESHRFQVTPRKSIKVNGRKVNLEQRVECGRNVSAVYSGV
jgi:alpha-tubulin suppressor-like RCC1 family protein